MNKSILLVGLIVVIMLPFILTPRWFSDSVVVEGDTGCYYFSILGNSLSSACPDKSPIKLHPGKNLVMKRRQDQVAYEVLVPIEALLILGTVLLSRALQSRGQSEMRARQSPLNLKDL